MRSPMFAMPFGRILWKEYRSQRMLWVCCFLFGFLFQALYAYWTFDVHSRQQHLFNMAIVASVMYAVGCGAVLFASEREDRTSSWLLSLSIAPTPVMAAKFAF